MFLAEAVGMATKIVTIACVWLCGLIVITGGKTGQYRECFADQTCFVLISNFDGNNKTISLNDARDSCRKVGSTLAEIRSSEIQNYTNQFLTSAASVIYNVSQKNVIVNAMRHDNNTWYWINGNEADNVTVTTSPQTVNQTVGLVGFLRLINNNSIVTISTAATSNATGYICEYPNTTIPFKNCTFQHDQRCFVLTNMTQTNWFSARNNCLADKGDLASLEFTGNNSLLDLLNVSQWFNRNTSYWIGLRQSWWIWEGSGDEVNYTNWKSDAALNNTSLKCISLSYNSTSLGQWISTDCNANSRPHILCLSGAPTKSTTMTSMVVPTAAYDLMTPTNTLAIGLGVGLGLIVALLIVALIILVVLIIRKRLLTDDNYRSSQSSLTSAEPTKLKRGNETSLYAEVQKNQREDGDTPPTYSTPAAASDSIMLQPCYATVRGCEAKTMAADVDPAGNQTLYADFDIRQ